MSALLGPDEFSLQDKLESPEHLQGRLAALRRIYQKDRRLAREVISYAWPHERKRPWTSSELRQKLWAEGREKAAQVLLKEAASEFLYRTLPSAAAAFDAFEAERARQDAIEAQANAQRYPAMAYTQPTAMQYAMGGGQAPPPVHHHRRHRHHG